MYSSRTKPDLIIEVWERLDCESVGAKEIIEIEKAVEERFGKQAVEYPMRIARQLADEGAELRHAEIMELDVERRLDLPYDAMFRNILRLTDLRTALASLRNLENLRRKFVKDSDKEGLRLVRETALEGKQRALETAQFNLDRGRDPRPFSEMAEWITLWLQSPELFESWITLRIRSNDFVTRFGSIFSETTAETED